MKDFSSLNEVILNLFDQKEWNKGVELLKIRKKWKKCVGEFVASQTQPVKIMGKTLIVGVKNNLLMTELKLNQAIIVEKLRELTDVEIKDIKFYILQETRKKNRVKQINKIPAHEAKKLKEQIDSMKDPEIKRILLKTIEFLEEQNEKS